MKKKRGVRLYFNLSMSLIAIGTSACTAVNERNAGAGGSASGEDAFLHACPQCTTTLDCGPGSVCAQFGGDSYCAPSCADGDACAVGRVCTVLASVEGVASSVCAPTSDICGDDSASKKSSGSGACNNLAPPNESACCKGCSNGNHTCQANGCYGGWYCNTSTC